MKKIKDYNFQSIKKFVACKGCQYYENEKCMNKGDCFWLELERKLKALEIIKNVDKTSLLHFLAISVKNQEDYELVKEVLL